MTISWSVYVFYLCGCRVSTCGSVHVCVCPFPDVLHLETKQASALTPVLSLTSLIGPESLQRSSLSWIVLPSFFFPSAALWLHRLAGRQEGSDSPIVSVPGTQLWAKSVQNVKHRWPLTHKWVHRKQESLLCQIQQSPVASFFFLLSLPHLSVQHSSTSPPVLCCQFYSFQTLHIHTHSSSFFLARCPSLFLHPGPSPRSFLASGSQSGLISIELSCV